MDWIINQLEVYFKIIKYLLPAVPMTLFISILSFLLAVILGLLVALMRISHVKFLQLVARVYVDVLRGVPLLVQIFFIYFGLGRLSGILKLTQFQAGILAIGICYSAYISEIFRAGIQAIPRGQSDAALSLGMNRFQMLWHIVLPQAFRIVLPPVANEFIACLKDSSLVSIIGLRELTRAGREYYSQHFVAFETWFVIGIIYLIMTILLSRLSLLIERKYSIK